MSKMIDKVEALAVVSKDDDDLTKIIISDLDSLDGYVSAVYAMEYQIPILRARYDGQDLRDKVQALDANRRSAHERAIMGVKRLNRFSKMFNLEKFFDGDEDDRYAIADFCGTVVKEVFDGRTGVSIVDIRKEKAARKEA